MKGGIIGPLLTCLIGDQFVRMKKGDSFWYERTVGPQKFTSGRLNLTSTDSKVIKVFFHPLTGQLHQIFNTSLSTIICQNTDRVEYTQRYVMKRVSETNRMEKCSDLDTFDFEPWKQETSKVDVKNKESHVRSIKN